MTVKTYIRSIMLGALITLALGGFMLHFRIHPIAQNPSFLVPLCAGILSIVVVPLLFLFPKTIAYGYVLNGFLAVVGTIVIATGARFGSLIDTLTSWSMSGEPFTRMPRSFTGPTWTATEWTRSWRPARKACMRSSATQRRYPAGHAQRKATCAPPRRWRPWMAMAKGML